MEVLATYADAGISGRELYDVLTMAKGAKETIQTWTAGRFALVLAPLAVAFIAIGALGGRDYVLYFAFLLAIPGAALIIGLSLRRRIYLWRYLGFRDIPILAN